MTTPVFLATPARLNAWLAEHHAKETELLIGFYKKHTGKASITWPESVDEALCFGWIDGIRKSRDEESYAIRFTPRKPRSVWSRRNIDRVAQLNRPDARGRRRVRVHAVGFSIDIDNAEFQRTSRRFASLMRRLCLENGGTFVGL